MGSQDDNSVSTSGDKARSRRFKSIKVKVKVQGKIGAGRAASVKVMLPKAIKAELAAGKTGTIRVMVKVKNAAGKTVDRTITVRIKAKPKRARALSLLRLGF